MSLDFQYGSQSIPVSLPIAWLPKYILLGRRTKRKELFHRHHLLEQVCPSQISCNSTRCSPGPTKIYTVHIHLISSLTCPLKSTLLTTIHIYLKVKTNVCIFHYRLIPLKADLAFIKSVALNDVPHAHTDHHKPLRFYNVDKFP